MGYGHATERSAASCQRLADSHQRKPDLTQIKQMVTCCLDAVASRQ
ncbi:MAG: hypothetical protein F6K26_05300 [Moorea sp. SIO2I5]|nr:hypothetical protein [Moorena sp. SIO2I5]